MTFAAQVQSLSSASVAARTTENAGDIDGRGCATGLNRNFTVPALRLALERQGSVAFGPCSGQTNHEGGKGMRYSGFRLIREGLTGNAGWTRAWRDPAP